MSNLSGPLSAKEAELTPVVIPGATLRDGLISYFLADGSDDVGANSLTPVNGPTTGAGKVSASCMQFTRADAEYYRLPDADAGDFEPNKTRAFAVWLNAATVTSFPCVWSKGTSTESRAYGQNVGDLTVQKAGAGVVVPAGSIVAGVWNHLYVFLNEAGGDLQVSWNNGALSTVATGFGVANASDFEIGTQSSGGASNYWDGRMDQFCVWGRGLTTDERDDLYNGGSGRLFPN